MLSAVASRLSLARQLSASRHRVPSLSFLLLTTLTSKVEEVAADGQ